MKTMILVWGAKERGKSQSIKRLALSFPFISYVQEWKDDDYDSYVIGVIKDKMNREHLVGIENQGDPNSSQKKWITACVNVNCEVIVAASRSYGQTFRDAYDIANNNGYSVIEVTTLYHNGGSITANGIDLRDAFADNMKDLIMKCLE